MPPAVAKMMASLPRHDRVALLAKMKTFADAPFMRHPWAAALQGRSSDVMRLRQGNWRAICRVDRDTQTVIVDAVGHRREVYR